VPLPDSVDILVRLARRRLLAMSMSNLVLTLLGAAAALAALLVGIARYLVMPWAEPLAAGLLGGGVLAGLVVAILKRPSRMATAIRVDRRLGGFDRVSTAMELSAKNALNEHEFRQLAAADRWSEKRDLTGFDRVWPRGPLPALVVLGLLATAFLSFVPAPSDVALAERRATEELIEDEADRLEQLAEESPEDVADQLRVLAERLRHAETLEQALTELGEARQELAEQAEPSDLPRKTALAGLEQRLRQDPLAQGAGAAEQALDAEHVVAGIVGGDPLAEQLRLGVHALRLRQEAADKGG